jgi:hypothetical protein
VVWPGHLSAGGFDLWAANMLLRLLPFVDQRASLVNCVVGKFGLEDGTLRSERLTIDTANTRTEGGARLDLASDDIHVRLVPRSKVPQFFSLATPIEITGTVTDFGISVLPEDRLATVARWASSPALVPIQRIAEERLPPDGLDVCGQPWR